MAIDPVCGMEVDENPADAVTYRYQDVVYYFCSEGCKDEFQASPEDYVGDDDPSGEMAGG